MGASDQTRGLVALSLLDNFGPVSFKKLLETFGSIGDIMAQAPGILNKVIGSPKVDFRRIKDRAFMQKVDRCFELVCRKQIEIVTILDPAYPPLLRQIYDPPILLYVQGHLSKESQGLAVAMVGSRQATYYGKETARSLSCQLAGLGISIVSGLARGIDTAAHEGALQAKGHTVAVLGGGLLKLYPKENQKVADRILEYGALISEYPPDLAPSPKFFPIRNRIISGLSNAVVVVEAREGSGALITADAALEQGRDVYAVPGNVDSSRSAGTNGLIKQGARLVTDAADILGGLGVDPRRVAEISSASPAKTDLQGIERCLWDVLDREGPVSMDRLTQQCGQTVSKIAAVTGAMLEKRLIKELPGKYFVLAKKAKDRS